MKDENKATNESEVVTNSNESTINSDAETMTMKGSFKKKLAKKDEEIDKANEEAMRWKNEYYKDHADLANLRASIEKDHREVIKYRVEGFVDNLLGVLDSFEMAFKSEPKNEETKNYLQGFKYVYSQLLEVLKGEGIEIIEPKVGSKFDEKVMHAIETVEDEGEENIVKQVSLKGYKLYDHVIRAAMVITSKHPEKKDDKDDKNIA